MNEIRQYQNEIEKYQKIINLLELKQKQYFQVHIARKINLYKLKIRKCRYKIKKIERYKQLDDYYCND